MPPMTSALPAVWAASDAKWRTFTTALEALGSGLSLKGHAPRHAFNIRTKYSFVRQSNRSFIHPITRLLFDLSFSLFLWSPKIFFSR